MTKEGIQALVVGVIVALFVVSALGYLLVPETMLSIVGIESNPEVNFLVRTIAAALLALTPSALSALRRDNSPAQRAILIGLAAYMFLSSLVDLHAYLNDVVGVASLPSIVFRVALGAVIVWLIPPRVGPSHS